MNIQRTVELILSEVSRHDYYVKTLYKRLLNKELELSEYEKLLDLETKQLNLIISEIILTNFDNNTKSDMIINAYSGWDGTISFFEDFELKKYNVVPQGNYCVVETDHGGSYDEELFLIKVVNDIEAKELAYQIYDRFGYVSPHGYLNLKPTIKRNITNIFPIN
jgi:hypothetical protein